MNGPLLSVVVPTRDREDSIRRLLRALAADASAPPFEVIVVDDGSTDRTVEGIRALDLPYPLTVVEQRGSGPGAARNTGAGAARGEILLFLDDDVEPIQGTLAAHAAFHDGDDGVIGIGDLPPVVDDVTFFGRILRGWWEMMLLDTRKPGHRFGFTNLLTGHVSIRRVRFDALRGFDPALRCHEDWEFGYRAVASGLRMAFVPGAVARHYETSNLAKTLRRKFDEGVVDVQLAQRHPELAGAFPFSRPLASRKARLLKRLTFTAPRVAAWIAQYLERMLSFYELVNLRFRWRQALELMLVHYYWCGVRSVLPDRRDVSALISARQQPAADYPVIDLADGLDRAARRVDELRPSAMVLMLGDEEIARVHQCPGLEPWRGEHLRPLLAGRLRGSYLRALARRGAVPAVLMSAVPTLSEMGGRVTDASAPLMPDVELTTHPRSGLDMQHRPPVPPIHHVA